MRTPTRLRRVAYPLTCSSPSAVYHSCTRRRRSRGGSPAVQPTDCRRSSIRPEQAKSPRVRRRRRATCRAHECGLGIDAALMPHTRAHTRMHAHTYLSFHLLSFDSCPMRYCSFEKHVIVDVHPLLSILPLPLDHLLLDLDLYLSPSHFPSATVHFGRGVYATHTHTSLFRLRCASTSIVVFLSCMHTHRFPAF
jgi:hypothetical protein